MANNSGFGWFLAPVLELSRLVVLQSCGPGPRLKRLFNKSGLILLVALFTWTFRSLE